MYSVCLSLSQAISAGSRAGGEHLCFMGSGILDDDQEYNMVVANFLQRNTLFVSVVQVRFMAYRMQ